MKFLIDAQLPIALSRFLASHGCDCQHVAEVRLEKASDAEIRRYANDDERIVISMDEDFFYPASGEETKARFLWVRLGNCRTSALLAAIERLWPRMEESLKAGERIIELR